MEAAFGARFKGGCAKSAQNTVVKNKAHMHVTHDNVAIEGHVSRVIINNGSL